jgi:ribosome-associated protein
MLTADIHERLEVAARSALDKKAFELVTLDVTGLTSIADSFLLCSGASDRQVSAIADDMIEKLRSVGCRARHVEGDGHSGWILIDFGDFVVHVFSEEKRSYYALDTLWGDAPKVQLACQSGDR